jgi:hypothetical protein
VESVYKVSPGYSDKATSLFTLDLGPPQDLPDTLRGEAWMFVQARAPRTSAFSPSDIFTWSPVCSAHLTLRLHGCLS